MRVTDGGAGKGGRFREWIGVDRLVPRHFRRHDAIDASSVVMVRSPAGWRRSGQGSGGILQRGACGPLQPWKYASLGATSGSALAPDRMHAKPGIPCSDVDLLVVVVKCCAHQLPRLSHPTLPQPWLVEPACGSTHLPDSIAALTSRLWQHAEAAQAR